MKNDQKNPIYPYVPFACMFEQPKVAVYGNLHNWHLNKHIWSLNLNPWFKQLHLIWFLVALAKTTTYCHAMIMHHIVALH